MLSLDEAAVALKEMGKYGRVHSLPSVAGHLGHSTTNSGPFKRKLAALRDWGVITGKGDQVELTPVGLAIALPTGEDETAALREAFLNAKVFAAAYRALVKNRPLDVDTVANTAVRNHGVSAGSKDEFARSFVASAVAAGLAERPDPGHVVLRQEPTPGEGSGNRHVDESRAVRVPDGSARQRAIVSDPVLRQAWPVPGIGEVVLEIRATRPLAAKDYAAVGSVAERIEALVAGMTVGSPHDPPMDRNDASD
jgi:hypothetical protein